MKGEMCLRTWETHVGLYSLPGPYWTHVLFTWKSKEGLKVYVNGTLSTSDPSGKVSHAYGDPHINLVIGCEHDRTKRYENGAFDEFIIWERALTPYEIKMYFTAAVGQCLGRLFVGLGSAPRNVQLRAPPHLQLHQLLSRQM